MQFPSHFTQQDILTWAEALESDEYKQCKGQLCDKDGAMCCLGVALDVLAEGDWVYKEPGVFDTGEGWSFEERDQLSMPPDEFVEALVRAAPPQYAYDDDGELTTVTAYEELNDDCNLSFKEIAAIVREAAGLPPRKAA